MSITILADIVIFTFGFVAGLVFVARNLHYVLARCSTAQLRAVAEKTARLRPRSDLTPDLTERNRIAEAEMREAALRALASEQAQEPYH